MADSSPVVLRNAQVKNARCEMPGKHFDVKFLIFDIASCKYVSRLFPILNL